MGAIRDAADRLWNGDATTNELHPMALFLGLEEYRPGLAFVASFANVVAIATGDGLVLVDTGSAMAASGIHAAVRAWSAAPVHTVIFTHGHIDHVMGVSRFEQESRPAGAAPVRVVAHEAIRDRFARYRLTAGYNGVINARQFALPHLAWPTDYRDPDLVYRDHLTLEIGGQTLELHHDRGETDDHTWVWLPAHGALCTGDLFIWAAPNCGNPQKTQRYPLEWARALRAMARLGARILLPGHGPAIEGAERVAQALGDTAALLESLCEQTVALLNQGAPLDTILAQVHAPADLLARPYLRPVYDEPEFVVRNLVRQLAGWWDGNPARLKPPRDAALAVEVAGLVGGPERLIERARALAAAGDHALACQLAEWARAAAPDDDAVRRARAAIYSARAAAESSLMARNIFRAAAAD
jgi:glyoxylase-like metal-dependent hydrolase (beta-lactamase superfamily II)